MSQPPYQPDDTSPGGWGPPVPPSGAPVGSTPAYPPTYPSSHGGEPYGQQPYGGQPYEEPQYGYQQQYGSQPYGSEPYGGQPGWQEQQNYAYQGYPPYGEPPRGNGMAVAGFVLSFFVGVLGLIFSIIGLRRSGEPGRGLRGLAIAGIVISSLNILFWILIGIGLAAGSNSPDSGTFNASGSADDSSSSSPTSPAPAVGSETVADACHVIIPAVTGIQQDLQSASSVSDMLNKINQLADTVQQQGAASGDAAFTQDTANLAQQYKSLLQTAQNGGKPDYTSLAKAGEQVGYDCGKVGVVN